MAKEVTDAYPVISLLLHNMLRCHLTQHQRIITAPGADLDLNTYLRFTEDENHGRCNVVFVGVPLVTAQIEQLALYSQRFQVRR